MSKAGSGGKVIESARLLADCWFLWYMKRLASEEEEHDK